MQLNGKVTTQPHVISKPKAEKSPYLLGKSKVGEISPSGRNDMPE